MIELAFYQPEIPQNLGAAMRLSACMGVKMHIIEPCGFPFNARKIRQSAMDYIQHVDYQRHSSWAAFQDFTQGRRIILMTTKSNVPYYNHEFVAGDILLAGQESAGVPPAVHEAASARVTIPMAGAARSLNIINATAMILGEGLRQCGKTVNL